LPLHWEKEDSLLDDALKIIKRYSISKLSLNKNKNVINGPSLFDYVPAAIVNNYQQNGTMLIQRLQLPSSELRL
jgi:hypothetical protein